MSMSLYTRELLGGLQGIPGVMPRVQWPTFGTDRTAGPWRNRWNRYVSYVRWCSTLNGELFHIADHSNAQLVLGLPGTRTIITCHDLYPVAVAFGRLRFSGMEKRRSMFPTALRLSLMRRAAAVIAISQYTLEECSNYFGIPKKHLYVAYHGVSPLFWCAKDDAALRSFQHRHNIRPEQINILHVGSNDPRKNLETIFRVVAALRENSRKGVCFIKAGSSLGPHERKTVRSLGLQESVRDLGPLSAEDMAQVYRACHILLYPSFHEGFCRPVAEAMASGTPVVASNRGAIPEVVQGVTLLFNPEDADGMVSRIKQITESSDLREESIQRGRVAAEKFTWEAHAAAVADAYEAVIGRWV